MFGEVGKLAEDCPRAPPSLAQLKFKAESKITLDTVSAGRGSSKEKKHSQASVLASSIHLSWFIKRGIKEIL